MHNKNFRKGMTDCLLSFGECPGVSSLCADVSECSVHIYLPMKMEQTECSETSAYKLQTLGYYPKESIQHTEHGESLKSGMIDVSNYKTLLSNELQITNKYCPHRINYIPAECHRTWEIKI
jgi:hypothetical protein